MQETAISDINPELEHDDCRSAPHLVTDEQRAGVTAPSGERTTETASEQRTGVYDDPNSLYDQSVYAE